MRGDGIHYEPCWFKPWPAGVRDEFVAPNGDIHFEVGGIRIRFEICEDAWVANRPGTALALQGVDVILNPSASHFAFGKLEARKRLVLDGSRAYGVKDTTRPSYRFTYARYTARKISYRQLILLKLANLELKYPDCLTQMPLNR